MRLGTKKDYKPSPHGGSHTFFKVGGGRLVSEFSSLIFSLAASSFPFASSFLSVFSSSEFTLLKGFFLYWGLVCCGLT